MALSLFGILMGIAIAGALLMGYETTAQFIDKHDEPDGNHKIR